MAIDAARLKAVLFDYGNTLIEFTAPHVAQLDAAVAGSLRAHVGDFDFERFKVLRRQAYRDPYFRPDLRESTIHEQHASLIRDLLGAEATEAQLAAVDAAHHEAFLAAIQAPPYLLALLERLRARYRLALISNYPCPRSIRASVRRTGIARHMDALVVSAEVGHVKPHPLVFRRALEQLAIEPAEAVYIGDNWLGDVQGAKRLGMAAVHIRQFDTLEVFDREEGHEDADLVIEHLTELEPVLLGAAV